jgi:hypothetical protein
VAGSCECGNESSYSIKDREFLDQVIDCQVFKKYSVLRSSFYFNMKEMLNELKAFNQLDFFKLITYLDGCLLCCCAV